MLKWKTHPDLDPDLDLDFGATPKSKHGHTRPRTQKVGTTAAWHPPQAPSGHAWSIPLQPLKVIGLIPGPAKG